MKDNLSIGLLVVIAIASIANTVMLMGDEPSTIEQSSNTTPKSSVVSNAASNTNAAANNDANFNQGLEEATVIENTGPKTNIQFAELQHDFGKIEQESKHTKVFTFTNTGNNPLIISSAKGSCGCTVPNYPREPVQPGQTGEIEVVYSPNKQVNQQTKTVTITANTEPATTVLKVSANVQPVDKAAG